MRESGKVSILGLGAIAIAGMIVASFVFAKDEPANVGVRFMDALARHDVDTLTSLSRTGESDPAAVEKEKKRLHDAWDFCVNTAAKHFLFTWRITSATATSENHATVTVMETKAGPSAYEQKYELSLEKEGGKWVVDVGAISRDMFPALPSN